MVLAHAVANQTLSEILTLDVVQNVLFRRTVQEHKLVFKTVAKILVLVFAVSTRNAELSITIQHASVWLVMKVIHQLLVIKSSTVSKQIIFFLSFNHIDVSNTWHFYLNLIKN